MPDRFPRGFTIRRFELGLGRVKVISCGNGQTFPRPVATLLVATNKALSRKFARKDARFESPDIAGRMGAN